MLKSPFLEYGMGFTFGSVRLGQFYLSYKMSDPVDFISQEGQRDPGDNVVV